MPLVEAQAAFGAAGQMLALDPPLGEGDAATIGGVMATNDSGPLRHRYGGVRDLVVGMTVVLSDGTIAKVGRQGDQERRRLRPRQAVHGLVRDARADRAVAVRLHPAPARTPTLTGASDDPEALGARRRAARGAAARGRLPRRRLGGRRRLAAPALRRRHGRRARGDAARARRPELEDVAIDEDDDEQWARGARLQRGDGWS